MHADPFQGQDRRPRVLFVNDDETAQARLVTALENPSSAGPDASVLYRVEAAYCGQQGRDMVRESVRSGDPFALAFIRRHVRSGWDGVETALHLWQDDPDLPVALCMDGECKDSSELTRCLGSSGKWIAIGDPASHVHIRQLTGMIARQSGPTVPASPNKFHSWIDHLEDVVWTMDSDLTISYISPSVETVTGRPCESLIGTSFTELLAPQTREDMVEVLKQLSVAPTDSATSNATRTLVLELSRDGNSVWVEAKVTHIAGVSGSGGMTVGIARDITDRRKLEERLAQVRKMEAISRLAGGIAHDFNNLLTTVIGGCDMALRNVPQGSPLQADLEDIRKAGVQAATMTRQLLAFGRRQMLQPSALCVNRVIGDLERMLKRVLGDRIELVLHLDDDIANVYADPGQMGNVVMNLAVNARDAMPSGGRLTIATENVRFSEDFVLGSETLTAGTYVMVRITDNGIGMDGATLSRIFEPFYSTKEASVGAGLGLAVVYGTVRQSGGGLDVCSSPGRGTTFRLYFPVMHDESDDAVPVHPDLPDGKTVLVVEDEPAVRQLVCRILRHKGYRVLQASHGVEAMEVATEYEGTIHLLVTDAIMPHMNGSELIQKMAAVRPDTRMLVMSGYVRDLTGIHGSRANAVPFLQKPFSSRDLLEAIKPLLR
ncbi:MAG: hypothetical protein AMXMBFR84_04310 [Candidatus Hydrogenedentota bacterium]